MLASDGMKPLAPMPAKLVFDWMPISGPCPCCSPSPAPRGGNALGEGITVRCCGDWAQGAFGRSDRRSDAAELDGYVTVAAGALPAPAHLPCSLRATAWRRRCS